MFSHPINLFLLPLSPPLSLFPPLSLTVSPALAFPSSLSLPSYIWNLKLHQETVCAPGRSPAASALLISLFIFPAPYGVTDSSPAGCSRSLVERVASFHQAQPANVLGPRLSAVCAEAPCAITLHSPPDCGSNTNTENGINCKHLRFAQDRWFWENGVSVLGGMWVDLKGRGVFLLRAVVTL